MPSGDDNRNFGNLIRQIRESLSMTQKELALKSGLSYRQIQRYENGKQTISVPSLLKLSEAFGIPVDSFINPESQVAEVSLQELDEKEIRLLKRFRQLKSEKLKDALINMLDEMLDLSQ